eukprot:5051749-Amphidinium_carterae.1
MTHQGGPGMTIFSSPSQSDVTTQRRDPLLLWRAKFEKYFQSVLFPIRNRGSTLTPPQASEKGRDDDESATVELADFQQALSHRT